MLAARLGAGRVVGFDIDSNSLPYANRLAKENRVEAVCQFIEGDFGCPRKEHLKFDGVVANLYFDLLKDHARDCAAHLKPRGWFSFSGCSREREGEVRCAIEAAGLGIEGRWAQGRWVAFHGRKLG